MRSIILASALVLCALGASAAGVPSAEDVKKEFDFASPSLPVKSAAANDADSMTHEFRMTQERYRLYECLALSVVVIGSLATVLFFIARNRPHTSTDIVNASGLILIIFGTIFLVILTDAESQLSTGIGVMGAIAGYLFGKMQKGEEQGAKTPAGGEKG